MNLKIFFILTIFSAGAFGQENSYIGIYKTVSTIDLGLFGGEIIEINEGGYTHQVLTDMICPKEDCPSQYRPPFIPYEGVYSLKDTSILFQSSHMEQNEYVLVTIKNWVALLSLDEYEGYKQNGTIPYVLLARQ